MSRSALYELTRARTLEFLRTPEAMFWTFLFPVLLALAIGFAFREKAPDRIPVGVVNADAAEAISAQLANSPALLSKVYAAEQGRAALRSGRISLLVVPGPPVQYVFDPTRPESRVARLEANSVLQQWAGGVDPLPTADQAVTEQGSRYIDFLIPGLLGLNLMGTGMWGVGFSIVNARTRKLLKRLVATPMRKSDYMLAQILSRMLFLVFEVIVLVGFGWWFFGVAVRGSFALLGLLCVLGALVFSGLGLLVASRVETIEGVSGLMNFVMLPMWLLSGVFFSAERFPDWLQPLINALPLTALNDALRAVINEAAPLGDVAAEMAILVFWSVASFTIALKIFRWR
jgi:ABC-2 type transport system permease protein